MHYNPSPAHPIAAIGSILRNFPLILQLVRREVAGRYRGSVMGILWSLLYPLMMLGIYSFVFTVVFKARFGTETGARGEFALILFSGLILHQLLSECINRAPGLIMENANFVKKVIFPLEILVPIITGTAFFQFLVSSFVLFVGIWLVYGSFHVTILLAPVILAPFILIILGISWFLSALGVYLRDVAHIMVVLSTILLFFSTIFYPAENLPQKLQPLIYLNPLSFMVDQLRAVILWGKMPDWQGLGIYTIISMVVFGIGFWWFQKTRKGFADVI